MFMPHPRGLLDTLRDAGISPGDPEEVRRTKTLLTSATGLASVAATLWLIGCWGLGHTISMVAPLTLQLLLGVNLVAYLRSGNFALFRACLLAIFLITPFALEWAMGPAFAGGGVQLWALLAPVGAVLFLGPRGSLPWFLGYLALLVGSSLAEALLPAEHFFVHGGAPLSPALAALFFSFNVAAVSTLVYVLIRYASALKQRTQDQLEHAHQLLQEEQRRAEGLLRNILPGPIADRLKHHDEMIADGYAEVTVMFADIVNFTHVAEGLSPQQVFSMLNRIFSSFDELAERFGLEKIKTIGDAYMVAGGLTPEQAHPAAAMARMALAMQEVLARDEFINRWQVQARIGIGSGPVVAGIVGKKKFIYDLWGDTVNIASRITAEGAPGTIQVDETTWKHLHQEFRFLPPRDLSLKGKGQTRIYQLEAPMEAPMDAPAAT